jgi:hypothetical protein
MPTIQSTRLHRTTRRALWIAPGRHIDLLPGGGGFGRAGRYWPANIWRGRGGGDGGDGSAGGERVSDAGPGNVPGRPYLIGPAMVSGLCSLKSWIKQ